MNPETIARIEAVRTNIKTTLEARGHMVEAGGKMDSGWKVDDVYMEIHISLARTGRLSTTIGPYGHKKVFPEPITGYDYNKMADAVEATVAYSKELAASREAAKELYNKRRAMADSLGALLRTPKYVGSVSTDSRYNVTITLHGDLTPERIAAIAAVLNS